MTARGNIALASGKGLRRVYLALRLSGILARDVSMREWAHHEGSWRRPSAHPLAWLSESCWAWLQRKRAISKGRHRMREDFMRRAHPRPRLTAQLVVIAGQSDAPPPSCDACGNMAAHHRDGGHVCTSCLGVA